MPDAHGRNSGKELKRSCLPEPSNVALSAAERRDVLAVIPGRASASEFTLLRRLATTCLKNQPQLDIVIAGTTFDDHRLMSHPNLFVSGSIDTHELNRFMWSVRAGRILILSSDGPDSYPSLVEDAARPPIAYINPPDANSAVRPGDLTMPPGLSQAHLIEQISAWLMGA